MKLSKYIFLAFLILGSFAQANNGYKGFNLGYGFGIGSNSNSGDSYDADRTQDLQYFAMGSTHEKGMYLGFRYEQQNLKYSGGSGRQTATGVSLGFGQGGCYMTAHYFWKITRDLPSGTAEGNGNGFDFGYQFPFFYQNFLTLGIQYSIRYTSYDDPNRRSTTLSIPMFVLGGNF